MLEKPKYNVPVLGAYYESLRSDCQKKWTQSKVNTRLSLSSHTRKFKFKGEKSTFESWDVLQGGFAKMSRKRPKNSTKVAEHDQKWTIHTTNDLKLRVLTQKRLRITFFDLKMASNDWFYPKIRHFEKTTLYFETQRQGRRKFDSNWK